MNKYYSETEDKQQKREPELPMTPCKWRSIYDRPLQMTMGEFVTIMQLAKERLKELGAVFEDGLSGDVK